MGHYDNCRPENCSACGQALGIVWACGRKYCTTYHKWLLTNNPKEYKKIINEIKLEQEAEEEKRVVKRQIARQTKAIAQKAKLEAEGG